MFEPFKDLTGRLQEFLDGCLAPITPEKRLTQNSADRSYSQPTTVSDSPNADIRDLSRKAARLFNTSGNFSPEDLRASSASEAVGSTLVQTVPSLVITPSTLFPAATEDPALALLNAVRRGDETLCRTLLNRENGLEAVDAEGRSPLHWAALNGAKCICEMLVERSRGSDFSQRDKLGRTPLHCACLGENLEVAELLVRSGADIDSVDRDGNTALHYAATADNLALVNTLLDCNASQRTRNCEGHTPLDIAGLTTAPRLREQSRQSRAFASTNRILIKQPSVAQVDAFQGKPTKKLGPEDYEVVQQLGKGSFGEVFLVKRKNDDCLFAMKVLKKEVIMGQNLVKYARTERNILSYVRHPFIVSLSAAFQTAEELFLIMDYCPGGDMGWHLAREKRFSEHKARIYACEVLLALEHLHARDIIFRDLKPDNVVLDAQGHALLTDFGLSKEGVVDATSARSFCGSVAYLAPEMLKRQGHGKAVDWYLFGVLLYEMLTGSPPYFSTDREQLFRNILHAPLRIPAEISAEARSLLQQVRTMQLLERDPKKRLGSSRGADDVKGHSFFRGVRWDAVARRELAPPIVAKPVKVQVLPSKSIPGKRSDSKSRLAGWSFVSH